MSQGTYIKVCCELLLFGYSLVAGYGLSDDCLIDSYSMLRNDPKSLTHDKCKIQLFNRIFTSGPNLRCGKTNIDKELQLIEGSDTNNVLSRLILINTYSKSLFDLEILLTPLLLIYEVHFHSFVFQFRQLGKKGGKSDKRVKSS